MPKYENEASFPLALLLEPEEHVIKFICLGLSYEGYRIESCRSGLEGLELVRRIQPHLIIVELDLPDIAGLDFCRQLRADDNIGKMPLLALTHLEGPQLYRQAREAGVNAFVTKPFDFEVLLTQITLLVPPPDLNGSGPTSMQGFDFPDDGQN